VKASTLQRTQEQVTSTFEEVTDKLEKLASTVAGEAEKAGAEVRTELAALPEQLEQARRAVVSALDTYRPPERYRRYVQLGVVVVIVAVAIGIILGRRRAARSEAIDPEEAIGTIVETTI
jgi:hypothetical protein